MESVRPSGLPLVAGSPDVPGLPDVLDGHWVDWSQAVDSDSVVSFLLPLSHSGLPGCCCCRVRVSGEHAEIQGQTFRCRVIEFLGGGYGVLWNGVNFSTKGKLGRANDFPKI